MKSPLFLVIKILTMLLLSTLSANAAGNFYLDSNNVTIKCENAAVGESGVVNGITYTKIDESTDLIINGGTVDATEACTSGVTDMRSWFYNKNTFNKDISHWDTSNVTDMDYMFSGATAFNQPIGSWDTSNVRYMNMMFSGATAFNQPIGSWNTTSNVGRMEGMFHEATAFNQNISNWCVSAFSREPEAFDWHSGFMYQDDLQPQWGYCSSHFALADNGVTITCDEAPVGAHGLVGNTTYTKIDESTDLIINGGTVDATQACTSGVTNMSVWFQYSSNFDKDISHWDTSSVTNMDGMFALANSFNQDISHWNTSNVTSMEGMFYKASAFNQNISHWCVSDIPIIPEDFDYNSGFENQLTLQPQWGEECVVHNNINMTPILYLLLN